MALDKLIPRLEWNFLEMTGDTHSNTTVDDIASTADIKVGMYVSGTGIPAGTTVQAKAANSVTLSAAATSTNNDVALTFWERFDFTYPPSKDSDIYFDPQEKITAALSGARQVQVDFIEEKRDVTFGFLTNTERGTLMNDFFLDWAAYGEEFRYYPDKADSGYEEYELADYKLMPKRQVKKHPYFLYEMSFKFRRVDQ